MTPEEMQVLIGQMLAIERQLQERQIQAEERLTRTEAIAESNARAIEALGNKVSQLVQIVGEFGEATNNRLTALEDRP